MARVLYKYGSRAAYDALQVKDTNALYFLTDTGEICKGDIRLCQARQFEITLTSPSQDPLEAIALHVGDQPLVRGDMAIVAAGGSRTTYTYNGSEWLNMFTAAPQEVIPDVDGFSIELTAANQMQLRSFGTKYYAYVAEVTDEATGEVIPAHYVPQEVDAAHPWKDGLEPRVVLEGMDYILGWFEPNPTTVEGVNAQVTALQTKVDNLTEAVGDLDELLNAENTGVIGRLEDLEENTYSKEEVDSLLTSVFTFKGSLENYEALEKIESPKTGDVWAIGTVEYAWNGTKWIELGFAIDLTGYATKEELNAVAGDLASVSGKMDNLADLVGVPAGNLEDGTPVQATGIYADLEEIQNQLQSVSDAALTGVTVGEAKTLLISEQGVVNLPIFGEEGASFGLVPVYNGEDEISERMLLNAKGEWVDLIGDLGEYDDVVAYVNNALDKALQWLPIEE